jgi:hypothetical protein
MTAQEIQDLWRELALSMGNSRLEVSHRQLGLMNGLLADALKPLVGNPGLRDARLQFLRRLTELPITSSKQLPFAWVTTIIDQLIEKDGQGESVYPYTLSRQGGSEVTQIWGEIMKERGQLELEL